MSLLSYGLKKWKFGRIRKSGGDTHLLACKDPLNTCTLARIFINIAQNFSEEDLSGSSIIVGKLLLWDYRRNQIQCSPPKIQGYQNKIATKYETECKIL